jgi:hypothetical protein
MDHELGEIHRKFRPTHLGHVMAGAARWCGSGRFRQRWVIKFTSASEIVTKATAYRKSCRRYYPYRQRLHARHYGLV